MSGRGGLLPNCAEQGAMRDDLLAHEGDPFTAMQVPQALPVGLHPGRLFRTQRALMDGRRRVFKWL